MKTSIILAVALAFSGIVATHAQTTAPATPATAEPKTPGAPPEAKPADPNTIARLKLENARAAVSAGLYTDAMKTLTEVFALKGVSERNRTKSMAITADLCMRRQDWTLAKQSSERVINSSGADQEDRDFCKDVLKMLRKDHSELFQ